MAVRKANAVWNGTLKEGNGVMKLGSGAFEGAYSFATRFEEAMIRGCEFREFGLNGTSYTTKRIGDVAQLGSCIRSQVNALNTAGIAL